MTTAGGTRGRQPAAEFALASLMAFLVAFATATTRADVDLWGHVRFGLDLLMSGRLDRVDPYSFTSDRSWINHEWLAELVFAGAWRVAGNTGLIAVKCVSIGATLMLLAATLKRRGAAIRARVSLTGLALAGILQRVTHVRPQLFSVLLFAALVFLLHGGRDQSPAPRRLLLAIPLLGLWANLHGGWIVGVATLGLFSLGEAWQRADRDGAACSPSSGSPHSRRRPRW